MTFRRTPLVPAMTQHFALGLSSQSISMPTSRSKGASPRQTRRTRSPKSSTAAIGACVRAVGARGDEGARTVDLIRSFVPQGAYLEERVRIHGLLAEARDRAVAAWITFSSPDHAGDQERQWTDAVGALAVARDSVHRAAMLIAAENPALLGPGWRRRFAKGSARRSLLSSGAVGAQNARLVANAEAILENIRTIDAALSRPRR